MIQPERKHEWVAPPPGAGRHQVCKHCGHRRPLAPPQCEEAHAPQARNLHEYDPLDIEGDPR
jgi:hypothetical protein